MNLNIFKNISSILDFDTYQEKKSLSNNFNLYLKNDIKFALSMLDSGYRPTYMQQSKMKSLLLKESENGNFLYRFQNHFDHIPDEVFLYYLTNNNLSTKCKNEKTTYDNFKDKLASLHDRPEFYIQVRKALISSIENAGYLASNFKPKHEYTHGFDFNEKEFQLYSKFTLSIYNSLVLLPYLVHHINDFLEIKNTVQSKIKSIKTLLQNHNYKIIDFDNRIIHNHEHNCQEFKIKTLDSWNNYLENYDIEELKEIILEKTKHTFNKKQEINSPEKKSNESLCDITQQIIGLKPQLNKVSQQKIEEIIDLYQQVKNNFTEYDSDYENLYKDVYKAVYKYISIDIDYRNTLRNIEGKTPEELMDDSLDMIQNKFNSYIISINQDKVHELSAHQKKIKMKT